MTSRGTLDLWSILIRAGAGLTVVAGASLAAGYLELSKSPTMVVLVLSAMVGFSIGSSLDRVLRGRAGDS